MDQETQQIIKDQIASLPPKVRGVIQTLDLTKEIAGLREKHKLMLDQISTIELETTLTLIGLEPGEDFVKNLIANAGLKEDQALALAEDINTLIFEKVRRVIMEKDENQTTGTEETLDKETILREIENPTPLFSHTVLLEDKKPTPLLKASEEIQKYTPPAPETKTIVEQKLAVPTRIPPVTVDVNSSKIPQAPNTQIKSTSDPYREPIT